MKKAIVLITFLILILAACVSAEPNATDVDMFAVGGEKLKLHLLGLEHGLALSQIDSNGSKLLNKNSYLFELNILNIANNSETRINSLDGWAGHSIDKNGDKMTVTFSQPLEKSLAKGLKAIITIKVNGSKSSWDYQVLGLGEKHSLMSVKAPKLSLKTMADDNFFIPKYSGKLIANPLKGKVDYELLYPRGWSTSMQYLAYYGNNLGIYFGFHDPQASTKRFFVKAEGESIDFWSEVVIANKSLAANDWSFPGVFELDIFNGDWFDAAAIYKKWASANADYWPKMTAERVQRQEEIGRVGVWAYYSAPPNYAIEKIEKAMQSYKDFFAGVPVGIHWYAWNYLKQDDNYPDYFPERKGMKGLISRLTADNNAYIMPYINGRLYDTDLASYKTEGYPYASKDENGKAYTQDFNGNHFAVMCPTQQPWQETIAAVAQRLGNDLGSSGVYIDQVAAAGPLECMDKSHGHSLGGGSWWHDGYQDMLTRVRNGVSVGKFVTVEGGNDYLANRVDGFLTEGWLSEDLVPAFQVVYSGRVQLFGKRTGTSEYHKASYYAKLSQAFVSGIQPGRTSTWLVFDTDADLARPFIKQLATMRFKLREFLSFGSMLRPIKLNGNIPKIVSGWSDFGTPVQVSISAIQSSVYKNKAGDKIALIFSNASMQKRIDFSFTFDAAKYGLSGKLVMYKESELKDSKEALVNNFSEQHISLEPLETLALVFTRAHP